MQNNIINITKNGIHSKDPGNKQGSENNKHPKGSFSFIQPKERHGMRMGDRPRRAYIKAFKKMKMLRKHIQKNDKFINELKPQRVMTVNLSLVKRL